MGSRVPLTLPMRNASHPRSLGRAIYSGAADGLAFLSSGCAEADIWRSKSLIHFLDRQQRRGLGVNETTRAQSDRVARSRDVVGQIKNHHRVILAEGEIKALQ